MGWESFSLLGLVRVTRLCLIIGMASGLDWYDLLAKVLAMVYLHLRYSIIFLHNDGKGFISVSQVLHFIIWVLLSFLYMCIPHKVQTFRSMSIVSFVRLQFRIPKMRSQFAAGISAYSYAVSGELLYAKGNHVMNRCMLPAVWHNFTGT